MRDNFGDVYQMQPPEINFGALTLLAFRTSEGESDNRKRPLDVSDKIQGD